MKELVPQSNIHNYAIRNTSAKMPIEQKYLEAFVSSIFSSPELKELYERLQNIMWNEDSPMIFLSYWKDIGIINEEPYRSIVAYAMLKKDEKLFEMISSALFTGTFEVQWDQNFVKKIPHYTDENMAEEGQTEEPPYTDTDLYTDMVEGIPFLVFHNVYCDKYNNYTPSNRYQTSEELKANIEKFNILITVCKPARAEVILLYEPYVFVHMTIPGTNAGTEFVLFNDSTPAVSSAYTHYINNLTNEQILNFYNTVEAHDDLKLNQVSSYPDTITPKTDIKFNDKLFVGDSKGGIRSSVDGKQFEFITSLPTSINSLMSFNSNLYASRDIISNGDFDPRFYISSNGKTFVNPYSSLPNDIETFTLFEFNNTIYAGTTKGLYVSTDLFNFNLNKSIPENHVTCLVVYNNKLYAGTNKGLYVSEDGVRFVQSTTFPTNIYIYDLIVKNNKLYVGTSGNYLYMSLNGVDFIQNTTTSSTIYSFIIYNNNLYAGANNGVYVLYNSATNEHFTRLTFTVGRVTRNKMVVYNNALYVYSFDSGAHLYKSTNGTTFSLTHSSNQVYGMGVYNNELYISENSSGNLGIYTTTNGQSFVQKRISTRSRLNDNGVWATAFLVYNNSLYVAMESSNHRKYRSSFYYFDDTNNRFREKSPIPALLASLGNITSMIEYHNELFIGVADSSPTDMMENYRGIYKTSDCLNFTKLSGNPGNNAKFYIINDRLFVYNLYDGLKYSDDGETFSSSSVSNLGNVNYLLSMCEFNNKIYAIFNNLGVYVSSDNGGTFTLSLMFDRFNVPNEVFAINNTLFFIKNIRSSSNKMSIYQSYDGETVFQQKPILPYQIQSIFQYNNIIFFGMLDNGLFICENYEKPQDQYVIMNKSISDVSMSGRYLKIEIMTTKEPFVWSNLKLLSGDVSQPVHLPDITIKPVNVITEQKTSSKYFITVELFFQN